MGLALFAKRSVILLYVMNTCCFRLCKADFVVHVAASGAVWFLFSEQWLPLAHSAGWERKFPDDVLLEGVTCVDQDDGSLNALQHWYVVFYPPFVTLSHVSLTLH